MTHQEKLAFIREKVIEAVPEIVELKFGCRLMDLTHSFMGVSDPTVTTIIEYDDPNDYEDPKCASSWVDHFRGTFKTPSIYFQDKEKFEIIGRPIRLADVLLAITHCEKNWHQEYFGCVSVEMSENSDSVELSTNEKGHGFWNLRKDDLNEQDEATISFLYEILK